METFEEAQQREGVDGGGGGAAPPFPRRKHAFRIVAPAVVEDPLSSPMQPPNTSTSTTSLPAGGNGGSNGARSSRSSTLPGDAAAAGPTAASADGGEARKGSWRTSAWSPGSTASGATEGGAGVCKAAARQQVWVLAATNAKVSFDETLCFAAGGRATCKRLVVAGEGKSLFAIYVALVLRPARRRSFLVWFPAFLSPF